MKKQFFLGMPLLLLFVSLAAQEKKEEPQFKAYWRNGFKVESTDKQFKLAFGGLIQYDYAFFMQDQSVENSYRKITNATEIRRARLYHSGTLYGFINYKLQLDFAGLKVNFKDAYISFSKIPVVGTLTLGQFKVPLRLESLTSNKYLTFMERALPITFLPDRSLGLMLSNDAFHSRLSWQAGIFRNAEALAQDVQDDSRFNIVGRITGLPIKKEDNTQLLHVGLSYSFRNLLGEKYIVLDQPESHLAPIYAKVDLGSQNVHLIAAEAAYVDGPFSLQGEFVTSLVNEDSTHDHHSFISYYGQVSYFLTGENRKYEDSYNGFGRVSPQKNLGKEGSGAWEIALRYSGIDLNSGNTHGGQFYDLTAGVNWYMNPVTRIMFNYIFSHVKEIGNTNILQTRFQVDF